MTIYECLSACKNEVSGSFDTFLEETEKLRKYFSFKLCRYGHKELDLTSLTTDELYNETKEILHKVVERWDEKKIEKGREEAAAFHFVSKYLDGELKKYIVAKCGNGISCYYVDKLAALKTAKLDLWQTPDETLCLYFRDAHKISYPERFLAKMRYLFSYGETERPITNAEFIRDFTKEYNTTDHYAKWIVFLYNNGAKNFEDVNEILKTGNLCQRPGLDKKLKKIFHDDIFKKMDNMTIPQNISAPVSTYKPKPKPKITAEYTLVPIPEMLFKEENARDASLFLSECFSISEHYSRWLVVIARYGLTPFSDKNILASVILKEEPQTKRPISLIKKLQSFMSEKEFMSALDEGKKHGLFPSEPQKTNWKKKKRSTRGTYLTAKKYGISTGLADRLISIQEAGLSLTDNDEVLKNFLIDKYASKKPEVILKHLRDITKTVPVAKEKNTKTNTSTKATKNVQTNFDAKQIKETSKMLDISEEAAKCLLNMRDNGLDLLSDKNAIRAVMGEITNEDAAEVIRTIKNINIGKYLDWKKLCV